MTNKFIIGVDEVGWGCVAGPLTVCACYVPEENHELLRTHGFRDSKKVGNRLNTNPERKRTEMSSSACIKLADWLNEQCDILQAGSHKPWASWAIGSAIPQVVDLETPGPAKQKEFRSAVMRLMRANGWTADQVKVIIDGNQLIKGLPAGIEQEAIPKADDTILPVSVASVLAKADRDRHMLMMHRIYPQYGFDGHKGYPTPAHLERLLQLGPVHGLHRWSYLEKWVVNHFKKTRPVGRGAIPMWLHDEKWIEEILKHVQGETS